MKLPLTSKNIPHHYKPIKHLFILQNGNELSRSHFIQEILQCLWHYINYQKIPTYYIFTHMYMSVKWALKVRQEILNVVLSSWVTLTTWTCYKTKTIIIGNISWTFYTLLTHKISIGTYIALWLLNNIHGKLGAYRNMYYALESAHFCGISDHIKLQVDISINKNSL